MSHDKRLNLSIGARSAELLARGINRLDSDEVREAERLGLSQALQHFLSIQPIDEAFDAKAREFGTAIEELWQKTNMRFSHPLDLDKVWRSLGKALRNDEETPEFRAEIMAEFAKYPDEPPYGIGEHGQFDEPTLIHVAVYAVVLGYDPTDKVTVGIKRGHGRWSEGGAFWPELKAPSNLWKDHAIKIKAWAETAADDRITTARRVAERLLELLSPNAFKHEVRIEA